MIHKNIFIQTLVNFLISSTENDLYRRKNFFFFFSITGDQIYGTKIINLDVAIKSAKFVYLA